MNPNRLLYALEHIRDAGPPALSDGICRNVRLVLNEWTYSGTESSRQGVEDLLRRLGLDPVYPIERQLAPRMDREFLASLYHSTRYSRWEPTTPHGAARWALLDQLITLVQADIAASATPPTWRHFE